MTCRESGVYIVELADGSIDEAPLPAWLASPPIALAVVRGWLNSVSTLRLDGHVPTPEELVARLATFWWPDSRVLYVGMTEDALSRRVRQFYRHVLSRQKPHRGGHWIKTLDSTAISKLEVVMASTSAGDAKRREDDLLAAFAKRLVELDPARAGFDPRLLLPWANLRGPRGDKPSGITGSTT